MTTGRINQVTTFEGPLNRGKKGSSHWLMKAKWRSVRRFASTVGCIGLPQLITPIDLDNQKL